MGWDKELVNIKPKDVLRQCRQGILPKQCAGEKFHMCTPVVKLTLFRTYCSRCILPNYGGKLQTELNRKLYVAYNNGLRILLNIPQIP